MKDRKNALEWSVFALSCALILATIVVLARDALTTAGAPATFTVEVQATARDGEQLLRLRVRNSGDTSAERVQVQVVADPNIRASIELDFVPRSSTRDAYVTIPAHAAKVQARVTSWVAP